MSLVSSNSEIIKSWEQWMYRDRTNAENWGFFDHPSFIVNIIIVTKQVLDKNYLSIPLLHFLLVKSTTFNPIRADYNVCLLFKYTFYSYKCMTALVSNWIFAKVIHHQIQNIISPAAPVGRLLFIPHISHTSKIDLIM